MKSIERTIGVITYLSSSKKTASLAEVSRQLRINKSSAFRILGALENAGWVKREPETNKYFMGKKLLEIGLSNTFYIDLRTASLPYLKDINEVTKETSIIALRDGIDLIFFDQLQSRNEVRHVVELGKRMPLWCGAAGKAILTFLEKKEQEKVINFLKKSKVRTTTSGQPVEIDRLREELLVIRQQYFAVTVGERVAGACGVAAPIFGDGNSVIGAIGAMGPHFRFTTDLAVNYGPLVSGAAREITQRMKGNFIQRRD